MDQPRSLISGSFIVHQGEFNRTRLSENLSRGTKTSPISPNLKQQYSIICITAMTSWTYDVQNAFCTMIQLFRKLSNDSTDMTYKCMPCLSNFRRSSSAFQLSGMAPVTSTCEIWCISESVCFKTSFGRAFKEVLEKSEHQNTQILRKTQKNQKEALQSSARLLRLRTCRKCLEVRQAPWPQRRVKDPRSVFMTKPWLWARCFL